MMRRAKRSGEIRYQVAAQRGDVVTVISPAVSYVEAQRIHDGHRQPGSLLPVDVDGARLAILVIQDWIAPSRQAVLF